MQNGIKYAFCRIYGMKYSNYSFTRPHKRILLHNDMKKCCMWRTLNMLHCLIYNAFHRADWVTCEIHYFSLVIILFFEKKPNDDIIYIHIVKYLRNSLAFCFSLVAKTLFIFLKIKI